ncbi:MAG: DUF362 domain-containing protein [Acidobacteriota bacterium]
MTRKFTRRELGALVGTGIALGPRALHGAAPAVGAGGTVGVAPLAAPAGGGALDPTAARAALERALVAATGKPTAARAVSALFSPSDTVGIKLNCLGGPISPRRELVEALAALLREAGIPGQRIVVFERASRELARVRYPIRKNGGDYLCHGVDNDYDAEPSTSGQIGSCFARLVSTTCTALVGFGVVKDHDLAGVSASLKNWYGVIHNPNKYHDNHCDPFVADVVNHPFVRGKLRLTVLDGVNAQCHGGPGYRPDAVWPLGLVVASTDPVAADAWAWRAIDAERVRRGMPTLEAAGRAPRFVATAARYGLGVGDPAAIREARG